MATFDQATVGYDVTPDFGAQRNSQPRVTNVSFGDGYQQRVAFGINTNPKVWNLKWSAISNAAADAIEAFFEARNAVQSFDWTPLNSATSYKWICRQWTRDHQYADINTITATFEQVFEA